MNTKIVTVTEFRRSNKELLDKAETFMLRRGDQLFEVRFYGMVGVAAGYKGETYEVNNEVVTPSFGTWQADHPKVETPTQPVLPKPAIVEHHLPPARPQPTSLNSRRKPDILDEIKAREALRDEDLEYSQDADTNRSVIKAAKEDLDALWIEYNAL